MRRSRTRAALLLRFSALVTAAVLAVAAAATGEAAARPYGSSPLDDIITAADRFKRSDCNLGRDYLAALAIAPTFPETGGNTTVPPSPFTLSRSDTSAGLYPFGNPSTSVPRAFFHPGVGLWQADSGGLGRPHSADYWVNTATAAPVMVAEIARLWCQAWADPATYPTEAARRARAWSPWVACRRADRPCDAVFNEVFNGTSLTNLTRFANVSRTGGLIERTCRVASGATTRCWFADPARAEGNKDWTAPGFGPSPVTAPFYVYELNGAEHRHWLRQDTGYANDIHATRPLTANPRTGLSWEFGGGMCDVDLGRGSCHPNETLGPPLAGQATHPQMVGGGRGVGAHLAGSNVAVSERRSDGSIRVVTAAGSSASTAFLGGFTVSDPDIAAVVNDGLEVVVRGLDNQIWRTRSTSGTWSAWTSLGGAVTSAPTLGSRTAGRTDVFVRGTDNALWTGQTTPTGFLGWSSLGGVLASDPEVAIGPGGRIMVFAVGTDSALWYRHWDGSQWLPWDTIGGVVTSSPGAVSAASNRTDVVARGADGALWARSFIDSAWTGWAPLGGQVVAAPDLTSIGSGNVRVYARGTDERLWFRNRTSAGWSPWGPAPW